MLTNEQIDEFRLPEKLRPGDPEGRKLGLLLAQARAYNALRERVLGLADRWERNPGLTMAPAERFGRELREAVEGEQ